MKSLSSFSHIWNPLQCVHCQVLDSWVSVGGQRTTVWPAQDSCWHNEASKQASVSPAEKRTHSEQVISFPFSLIVSVSQDAANGQTGDHKIMGIICTSFLVVRSLWMFEVLLITTYTGRVLLSTYMFFLSFSTLYAYNLI